MFFGLGALCCALLITWLHLRSSRCATESMTLANLPISSLRITDQRGVELSREGLGSERLNEWARAHQASFEGARCSLLGGSVGLELSSLKLGAILVFRE